MTRELIDDILNKAKERLESAEYLLEKGNFDDSISRSYYAILDSARLLLEQEGVNAKTHSGVISKFGELFIATNKIPKKFGIIFNEIEHDRLEADYSAQVKFERDDATHALAEAKEFVAEVEKHLGRR